ncbi:hypothetical protein [Nocardiopsis potens]|uniref:hypothetical protein n=1 Tax=Nocardiopsis potens TaxID=1246458 RepID=UPI0003499774|nr:hypothetical protein [Nocardiopsis potens]
MNARPGVFAVVNRRRITSQGVWLTAACLVFISIGVALVLRGGPADVLIGAVTVVLFAGGGLLVAGRRLSRRPFLELDSSGVRLLAPWPRRPSDDIFLPWDEVASVCLCRRSVAYADHTHDLDYLHFLAGDEKCEGERGPVPPPSPWTVRPGAAVRSSWDRSVEEVLAEVHRLRPALPITDRRTAPPRKR